MDKYSYALGMNVAKTLVTSGVTSINLGDFNAGILSQLPGGDPEFTDEEMESILTELYDSMKENREKIAKTRAEEWMNANSSREGVVSEPGGLQYRIIGEGSGDRPGPDSDVECSFSISLPDGKVVGGQTESAMHVRDTMPAIAEALFLMKEGSEYEVYIPYQMAYGETGVKGVIPPYSPIIVNLKLLKVK